MITPTLQTAQYRLARHYLDKLRSADAAVRHGPASVNHGLMLFDQDWEQIRFWQAWAAQHKTSDETWTWLCKEFPLVGSEVLPSRNNAADQADWFLTALEAAHQLNDQAAELSLCYKLFMIYYRLGIPEKIESYASQLLKLGEAAHDRLSVERAWFGFGLVAEERGVYAEAEAHYERALQLSLELGDDGEIGQALNGLGTVAAYRGDYQKAIPYFQRQLELMEATGKKSDICHALLAMGGVFLWQKNYASADDYLQRAATMSQTLGLRRLFGVSLIHLGASALEQNRLDAAYRYLEQGVAEVRAVGVVRQIMNGLSLLGYARLRLGDPSTALEHLQEGLAMAREAQSPRNIFNVQVNLAKTYIGLNDPDSARDAVREVVALAQSLAGYPQKVEAISTAVAYYQGLNRNEPAAVWAGTILGDAELDQAFIMPIYAKLEAALSSDAYQAALSQGKKRSVDDVVTEIASLLA